MKIVTSLVFTCVLLFLVGTYSALATFSEHREYSRGSLDYYLLTPNDLAEISKLCENEPRFIYSSADGPKPAIIHLHCFYEQIEIDGYLAKNKFIHTSNNHFKKGETEIGFEKNESNKVDVTTVYEYL